MRRLRSWLAAIPGGDAVERRQAYLLQVVLYLAVTVFVIGAVGSALTGIGTGSAPYVAPNLTAAAICAGLALALRRGHFRIVAGLTIGFLIFAFAQSLAAADAALSGTYLALLMLPLVLAGLILPRIGLLITTVAVLAAGQVGIAAQPAETGLALGSGNFFFATLLVAAVVDQFGGTVRAALANAIAREQELETARADLQTRTTELQIAVAALEEEMAQRQRIESERRAIEARVLEVQKLESLGVLAGGIAHDFNNLLVGIMGNAGLALLELAPDSEAHQRVTQVETAARRAADLAREMLAYSGKGRFIVAPLDLSELVREMTHLLQVSIGKSVVLKQALADRVVVEADATQLRQVVMNLVVNASDAIGEANGVITVATGVMQADRQYLAGTFVDEGLAEGDYAFIEVSDTGAGMDAATQARIFDPFFTTKFTGRGLGLAAVLGIIRAHHGALKVYSEPGRGSTFKLLLPTTEAVVAADSWPGRARAAWRGKGTVLVVDDEPMVRDVARAILERMGLEVVSAVDGEDAMGLFEADPSRFAVVLLDLTMPRLSGAETFSRIRAIRPDTQVVLMSGYNEEEASGRFSGKGLAGFVEKPFSPQDLETMIRRVLEPGESEA